MFSIGPRGVCVCEANSLINVNIETLNVKLHVKINWRLSVVSAGCGDAVLVRVEDGCGVHDLC